MKYNNNEYIEEENHSYCVRGTNLRTNTIVFEESCQKFSDAKKSYNGCKLSNEIQNVVLFVKETGITIKEKEIDECYLKPALEYNLPFHPLLLDEQNGGTNVSENLAKGSFKHGRTVKTIIDDYCCLDVETTGTDIYRDRICEVGISRVRSGKEVDYFQRLINPGIHIPSAATEINHITDDMVVGLSGIEDYIDEIVQFIGDDSILGFNTTFDVNILCSNGRIENLPNDIIRLEDFCKDVGLVGLDNNCSLEDAVVALEIADHEEHRALSDVRNTIEVYEQCKKLIKSNSKVPTETRQIVEERRQKKKAEEKVKKKSGSSFVPVTQEESQGVFDDINFDDILFSPYNIFKDKKIYLTGDFREIPRADKDEFIEKIGGEAQKGLTLKTDYLVVGFLEKESAKVRTAKENLAKGKTSVVIMTEDEFYKAIQNIVEDKENTINSEEVIVETEQMAPCNTMEEELSLFNFDEAFEHIMNAVDNAIALSKCPDHERNLNPLKPQKNSKVIRKSLNAYGKKWFMISMNYTKSKVIRFEFSFLNFPGFKMLENKLNNIENITWSKKTENDSYIYQVDLNENIDELDVFLEKLQEYFIYEYIWLWKHETVENAFGCCHLFEKCSDNLGCVVDERDFSKRCIYRKNLFDGRVFYGKNKNI